MSIALACSKQCRRPSSIMAIIVEASEIGVKPTGPKSIFVLADLETVIQVFAVTRDHL
jgi:hypothetical protein